MKTDRNLWIVLAALFCFAGIQALLDSIRDPGPHADEFILLGGTVTALGLAALFFAFEEYLQIRALARHMRRRSVTSSGTQRRRKHMRTPGEHRTRRADLGELKE
jgi:hypothetical protein